MSDDIPRLKAVFGLSCLGFGFFSYLNAFYASPYLHYWRLREMTVSDFINPDFPKKNRDYLVRGTVASEKPLEVWAK